MSLNQIIIVQDRRDNRVLTLLGTMNDVYGLLLEAEPLKKIWAHRQAVEMLAKQTTECAYFVSYYFNNASFCECLCPFQCMLHQTQLCQGRDWGRT
jgi:hypothetical protein